MKLDLLKLTSIVITAYFPASYISWVIKIPQQLVSFSIDNAQEMRDYYNAEKQHFRYSRDTAELLWAIVGDYGFDGYSSCEKLLNSNLARKKISELKLNLSCLPSIDSITVNVLGSDPSGWKFFYWCLFNGNKASYCLSEYRPGKSNKKH